MSAADAWIQQKKDRSDTILCPGGLSLYRIRICRPALNGLTVFFFSDVHVRSEQVLSFPKPHLRWAGPDLPRKMLLEALDICPADVLLFGGDLITDSCLISDAFQLLHDLPAKLCKLAVAGNWDLHRRKWMPRQRWLDGYRYAGFRYLENELLLLNDALEIYGMDDYKFGHPKQAEFQKNDAFHLLVSHNPDPVPRLCGDADLVLCGHTHGGQMRIPRYGAMVTSCRYGKRFEYGWYRNTKTDTEMYVSAGIGTTWFPYRLFAPPEAFFIEFTGDRV